MSILSIIVAMNAQGVIGREGRLPWHLPADLKYFKRITMGQPIVMGRKTHDSIARVLPGRENIVISRNPAYTAPGCTVLHSLAAVRAHAAAAAEIMVIGGATLYQAALPLASRIYLTEMQAEVSGDVYFPAWNRQQWREVQREDHPADAANPHPYSFITLERSDI
jgi:dihydrofolate reductase